MTVTTTNVSNFYVGNGTTTAFVIDFQILDSDWIVVYINDLVYLGSYTTQINSNQDTSPGGTVTFNVAPALNDQIEIRRAVPINQLTDYPPFTRFPAQAHESALDKLTMIAQQHDAEINQLETDLAALANEVDNLEGQIGNFVSVGDNVSELTNDVGYISSLTTHNINELGDVVISSPAKGDLFVFDGFNFVNLGPVGANTYVLTADSTTGAGVKWAPPAGGPGTGNLFPGDDPTLLDSAAAIIIGTNTPDTSPHVAIGPTVIQAKSDGTTNADLNIQRWGGATRIWQDNDFMKAQFDGPFMWLFGAAGAGESGPNGIFFEGDSFGAGNNHFGFIGDPSRFDIQNWRGGSIRLNVGAFNGLTELLPNLRGETNYTGFATPMLNVTSTDFATIASLRHGITIGSGSGALKLGSRSISSGGNGFGSLLFIQGEPSQITQIGDPDQTYLFINNAAQIALTHLGNTVLYTEAPANGGVIVNGVHGSERVLTLSDLGVSSYQTADQTVTNSTTYVQSPSLALPLAANSVYRVTGELLVFHGAGAAKIMLSFTAGGSLRGQISAVEVPGSTPLVSNTLGATLLEAIQPNGTQGTTFNIDAVVFVSAATSLLVSFTQAFANVAPTSLFIGSNLNAVKIADN